MSETQAVFAPSHARYLGAWGEIAQRISTRGQLQFGHIAVIVALASAYVNSTQYRMIVAFAMPTVSWIFVTWYRHNEGIIGVLTLYCGTFEKFDRENGALDLPPWFFRPEKATEPLKQAQICIQDYALGFRVNSDRATMLICVASPALLLLEVGRRIYYKENMSLYNPAEIIEVLALLWCLALCSVLIKELSQMRNVRRDTLSGSYDPETGLFNRGTHS